MWSWKGLWDASQREPQETTAKTFEDDGRLLEQRPTLWTPSSTRDPPLSTTARHGILSTFRSAFSQPFAQVQNIANPSHSYQGNTTDTVFTQSIRDRAVRVRRAHRKFSQLRDEELEARTVAQIEWAKCADLRQYYLESQKSFMEAVRIAMSSETPWEQLKHLATLQTQAEQDLGDMQRQADITKGLEEKLGSLQLRLQRRDASFVQEAQALVDLLSEPLQTANAGFSPLGSMHSKAANSPQQRSLDPLLEDYYDKAGDVGLIGEELANLDVEHQQAIAFRIFQADHDQQPLVSSAQFEQDYRNSRADIEQRLGTAIQEAEYRKQLCLHKGIDLDGDQVPHSEDSDDEGYEVQGHSEKHSRLSRAKLSKDSPLASIFNKRAAFRGLGDYIHGDMEVESSPAPIFTRSSDVLWWRSRVPEEREYIAPDDEIPPLQLEDDTAMRTDREPSSHRRREIEVPHQSWFDFLRAQIPDMRDFSTDLSWTFEWLRRSHRDQESSERLSDWLDVAVYFDQPTSRRKSTITHLRRPARRDDASSTRNRLAAQRRWVSNPELRS